MKSKNISNIEGIFAIFSYSVTFLLAIKLITLTETLDFPLNWMLTFPTFLLIITMIILAWWVS